MIYTQSDAEKLQAMVKAEGVRVSLSTLGGENRASLMILICLDKRETWSNNIMENSRYARFHADSPENKLEMFSGGYKLAKFRKCHTPTVEKIAEKLQKWIDESLRLG